MQQSLFGMYLQSIYILDDLPLRYRTILLGAMF